MALRHFILIDDDPIHNLFSKIAILNGHRLSDIEAFINPESALKYMVDEIPTLGCNYPVVVLLDIDMPTMSGWEFLEQFDTLDKTVKDRFLIYILTSSVNQQDEERAGQNPYVKAYLEKPLTPERLVNAMRQTIEDFTGND